jgi:hypothetical protein
METVKCIICQTTYKFNDRWFERNSTDNYICRICKIKKTTRSKEFRKESQKRSKEKLSSPNIKSRMSQKAIINNIKNSEKISESLKKYFENQENKEKISEEIKNRWKNPEYKEKMSEEIKNRWKNPEYKGKIIGSRIKFLNKKIKGLNIEHQCDFTIGPYTFDAFINEKYLYDSKYSKEKALFVEHNLTNIEYINDLKKFN